MVAMLLLKKKVTQVGREGKCVTFPKAYLDSLELKGYETKGLEMMMQIHDDDSILLVPILVKKK
ncbi:MAG: hypothetical protein NTX92_08940 [Euryarchaeota archaeon]|nr:hypothetical protein [Euryarchaeota archaeon]